MCRSQRHENKIKPQASRERIKIALLFAVTFDLAVHPTALIDVDVRVLQSRSCNHHAVRVEGRCGDGREALVMQEASVRLKAGEVLAAVEVKQLDHMAFGTTAVGR